MKLSIIVPVFNEEKTLPKVLDNLVSLPIEKEIIVVDDKSIDSSAEIIRKYAEKGQIVPVFKDKNEGKGSALRAGFSKATGKIITIQDADLEYDPLELIKLRERILCGKSDVVYGNRSLGENKSYSFLYYMGNVFLSFMTSLLYNTWIQDMETCYKMFRREVIKDMPLRSRGFDIEPEITAKILKRGYKILEVPINYTARNREEGKKITWKDGVKALFTLLKYRFTD